jgi:hypothetical protein
MHVIASRPRGLIVLLRSRKEWKFSLFAGAKPAFRARLADADAA